MTTDQTLIDQDLRHLWHPFTHHGLWGSENEPVLVIERAEGNSVIDIDGRRYLDAISSLWCNTLGHRVAEIDNAIRAQLDKVAHSTLLGLSSRPAIELATKIAGLTPGDLNRVFFSDAGATAVEIALKIAVQYTKIVEGPDTPRQVILSLVDAYHGDTVGAVSLGYSSWFHRHFEGLRFDVSKLPCPAAHRRSPDESEAAFSERMAREAVQTIEAVGPKLQAVVIEPLMQGAAGMLAQPEGFLSAVADATRRVGGILIADEVATGLWRTGERFACNHEAVVPDILCLAKGLSGGYLPMAATVVRDAIFEPFQSGGPDGGRTFFHGHTYTGNALGAAASLAALDLLETVAEAGRITQMVAHLQALLEPLKAHPHVLEIRQRGLMVGVELALDPGNRTPYAAEARVGHQVALAARSMGVLLRPLGSVMILMPPFSFSDEELETTVEVLSRSIDQITRQ